MQPAAAYPTGQYADPQYHTSNPQQPPAPYPPGEQPPDAYTQQPPAQYPLDNHPLHRICMAEKPLQHIRTKTRLEAGGQLRPNRRLLWETGGQLQWRLVDIVSGNFRSNDAARVACRQLGFSTYARYGTVERLGIHFTDFFINQLLWDWYWSDCSCHHHHSCGCRLFSVFARRRRRLGRHPRSTPLINNVTSTSVVVNTTNTQDTAYPIRNPPSSPQTPSQNMQPAAAYPTGQYADPQYHTSYPQQPLAPYPPGEQPPDAYTQQPPAQYPTGQPPSAPYLYGGEAPPAYPN